MYIDFHNHMDFYMKDKIEDAILDINNNSIYTIACSMDIDSYILTKEIATKSEYIIPIFGIHPWKVNETLDIDDSWEEQIKYSPIIGEIGLDFHWVEDKRTYSNQLEVFEHFLQKAKQYNKYINVHTKGAENIVYELLKKYNLTEQSIIHWYSGDKQTLCRLIDAKCFFTISVDIGYSELTNEIAKIVPTNQILCETDGPTALEWVNGEYGMPSEIKRVYKDICDIKKIEIDELKINTYNTLKNIIRKCD